MSNRSIRGLGRVALGCAWAAWALALAAPTVQAAPSTLERAAPVAAGPSSLVAPAATLVMPQLRDRGAVVERLAAPATHAQALTVPRTKPGAPRQIGFSRTLAWAGAVSGTVREPLEWHTAPDGGAVAHVAVESPGAVGLRMAIRIDQLPSGATLRFYGAADAPVQAVTAGSIKGRIDQNRAAGEPMPDAAVYWSPVIQGPRIGVEVHLPAGTPTSAAKLAFPSVSHLVALAGTKLGSCHIDAVCNSYWSTTRRAVAQMTFVKDGNSYDCTGTLLNDYATSNIPYLVTANHCISTQAVASTLETYWFWESASCNSSSTSTSLTSRTGGATLLRSLASADGSFLRLNDAAPAGSIFAGWNTEIPAKPVPITTIHHPQGAKKKLTDGSITSNYNCNVDPNDGSMSCSPTTATVSPFFGVDYTQGSTEGGSSGAGLFLQSNRQLVGTLLGGAASCDNPTGRDFFGNFGQFYVGAGLGQWLESTATYALTANTTGTGSGAITSDPAAINCPGTCSGNFGSSTTVTLTATPARGSAFAGWAGYCSGRLSTCAVPMSEARSVTAGFTRSRSDFDGDGNSDIFWRNADDGSVALWRMSGGSVVQSAMMSTAISGWDVVTGDVDGDGRNDLVWRNRSTGQNVLWLMDGASRLQRYDLSSVGDSNWRIARLADVDGDGKADILWRHDAQGMFAVWLMDGATVRASQVWGGVPAAWEIRGAADFNGDRKADIIWRDSTTGNVAIYRMSGTTILGASFLASGLGEWDIIAATDLDTDGRAELLFAHNGGTALATVDLTSAADAIQSTSFQGAAGPSWRVVNVGDYNADGQADYLWRHTDGSVALWLSRSSSWGVFLGNPGTTWVIQP